MKRCRASLKPHWWLDRELERARGRSSMGAVAAVAPQTNGWVDPAGPMGQSRRWWLCLGLWMVLPLALIPLARLFG